MEENYIKIIYNEDSDQFEAWEFSGQGKDLIYWCDDADTLADMIVDNIDELKASY